MPQPPDLASARPVATFSTANVDEAIEVGARLYCPHELELVGESAAFHMDLTAGRLGTLTAGVLGYGCAVDVDVHVGDEYVVAVPIVGAAAMSWRGVEFVASESTAALIRPGREIKVHGWGAADDQLALLKFDARALVAELRAMLGRDVREEVRFAPTVDLHSPRGAAWRGIAGVAINALLIEETSAFNPLVAVPLASTIMRGLLLAADHQYRDALDAVGERIRPRLVERALSIMEERSHEPLTVSGIALEVGCSGRALRYGFQNHVGTSPLQYLARIRMDRVHHALATSSPDETSVTEILHRYQVSHHSRFAVAYRAEYGVLPSVTLNKR